MCKYCFDTYNLVYLYHCSFKVSLFIEWVGKEDLGKRSGSLMTISCWPISWIVYEWYHFHPSKKLRKGNVFTPVCLFTGCMMSLPVWSNVPFKRAGWGYVFTSCLVSCCLWGVYLQSRGRSVQPLPVLTSSVYHCSLLIRFLLECIPVTYISGCFSDSLTWT